MLHSRSLAVIITGLGLVTTLLTTSCVPQRTGVETAPSTVPSTAAEKVRRCNDNLRLLGAALELYAKDAEGAYPPTLQGITPLYLKSIPTCPAACADTYSGGYATAADAFTIACKGRFHEDAGQAPDLPVISSKQPLTPSGAPATTASASPAAH